MLVIALKFYTIYHLILFSREQYVSFTYIDFICVNWNLTFHWNFWCYQEVVSIQMSQKLTDYISVNLICIFSESIINGMKIIVKSDDIVDVLENSFAQEIGAFYCSCHFRMLNATCNDTKVLRQCWKRVFHTEKKFQWKNSGALKNESWKKSNFIFCIISKFSIKMEVTL